MKRSDAGDVVSLSKRSRSLFRGFASYLLCLLPLAGQPARAMDPGRRPADAEASAPRRLEIAMPAAPGADTATSTGAVGAGAAGGTAGLDVGRVIETVRHHLGASSARPGALEAVDRFYRVALVSDGIELSVRRRLQPSSLAAGRAPRTQHEAIPFEDAPAFKLVVSGLFSGEAPMDWEAGAWQAEFNRAERRIADGLTERLTARDDGAEWDFVLDRPLSGAQDLVIEAQMSILSAPVRVSPQSDASQGGLPGETWRWALANGRGVKMGEMTVKDAEGRSIYRALPEVSATGLRLVLPSKVLAHAAFPVTIDPLISVEYPASDPVLGLAALGSQNSPAVAANGTGYLVLWSDLRSGLGADIYGARVSSAGSVLDPAGIVISDAAGDQQAPSVVWSGSGFFAVWQDHRSGGNWDIYGARITASGVVQDPAGLLLTADRGDETSPRIAWSGSKYLVVFMDSCANGGDIYAMRVSSTGTVADPLGIAISTGTEAEDHPSVAWDGTDFFVAWEDFRSGSDFDIYGSRVGEDGTVRDPAGIPISTAADDQTVPDLDWDGTSVFVVWQDFRSGSTNDVYGARVSSSGAVLDAAGIPISTAANQQRRPAVAFDGTNSLVVWQDRRSGSYDIYGARVSQAGSVLDAAGIPISTASGTQSAPRLAWDGTNYLVAWGDSRSAFDTDVYGARVSAAGVVADASGILISTSANGQMNPAVAWDGTNYFVVWEDYRLGNQSDLYAARVSAAGAILDGTGIPVSTATDNQLDPAVAWDGTDYFVVWEDFRSGNDFDIYGTRVSAAGVVADPGGIGISTLAADQTFPDVDWDGTNLLVVWQDSRSGGGDDIYGARVSSAGSVLDPAGLGISTAGSQQRRPAVAFDGSNHLVVWQDRRSGVYDIYGARVSPAGSVLDAAGIPISTAPDEQSQPDVASDGSHALVVWQDFRSGSSFDVYAARLDAAGSVVDASGIPVSTAAFDQSSPVVVWDGSNYTVAWQDFRSGTSSDIYLARLSSTGVVLPKDVSGIAVTSSAVNSANPALVAGASLRAAVAYNRLVEGTPLGSHRALLRVEYECPFDGGGARGPCLLLPAHANGFAAAAAPPTFTWAQGGTTVARVEFSASATFAKPRVWSGSYKQATSFVPTAAQWTAIKALAVPGAPIYWRVLGRNGSSTKVYPSAEGYTFTVGP